MSIYHFHILFLHARVYRISSTIPDEDLCIGTKYSKTIIKINDFTFSEELMLKVKYYGTFFITITQRIQARIAIVNVVM